jgi:hypothetical protein
MIVPAYSGAGGGDTINSYSFKTLVTPLAGSLKFKFSLENGTGRFAQISNIKLAITSSIKSQSYYCYKTANLDYVKTIDIPYGAQTANDTYPSEIGMFVLSNNVYAGGIFANKSGNNYVAKWNGSSWSELGDSKAVTFNEDIRILTTDANGNLYAAGEFTNSNGKRYVAKYPKP